MPAREDMIQELRKVAAEMEKEDAARQIERDAGQAAGDRWKREANPDDWDRLSRWAHDPNSFGPGDQHGTPSVSVLLYRAVAGEDGDAAASYWAEHRIDSDHLDRVVYAKAFIEGATGVRM